VPFSHQYTLESWSADGELVTALVRRVEWFRPSEDYWLPTPERPPAPRLMGVWEDSAGLVWTIAHVGDRRWRRGLGNGIRIEGQTAYPITDQQRVYDSVLEVIDPVAGRLLASRRFSGTFDLVVQPNLLAAIREAAAGWLYLEIWSVQLQRP
jgi:hypothetical protein